MKKNLTTTTSVIQITSGQESSMIWNMLDACSPMASIDIWLQSFVKTLRRKKRYILMCLERLYKNIEIRPEQVMERPCTQCRGFFCQRSQNSALPCWNGWTEFQMLFGKKQHKGCRRVLRSRAVRAMQLLLARGKASEGKASAQCAHTIMIHGPLRPVGSFRLKAEINSGSVLSSGTRWVRRCLP